MMRRLRRLRFPGLTLGVGGDAAGPAGLASGAGPRGSGPTAGRYGSARGGHRSRRWTTGKSGGERALRCLLLVAALACGVVTPHASVAATWEVGPGRPFPRIEDAAAQAQAGDTVLVHPRADGQPYEGTAVLVRRPGITFRAVPGEGREWVVVSGQGFDYSGRGSTPRAIFQFDRDADDCTLEGFELTSAHNGSHNGAGVRINQANRVTVRNCHIHGNDMGVMSNGDGTLERGLGQLLEHCRIHHNGSLEDPGYNHNLYLGGASVWIRFCEVHSSLTGHNVKSRAHQNLVEYSYIHDSANREFDLVDAADTERPGSHSVLLGNIIAKDPQCRGNRTVIHFGQDGGRDHQGTLHLFFNTAVSPFLSPVVELSAPGATAQLIGNLIDGGTEQRNQRIGSARGGAQPTAFGGSSNGYRGDFAELIGTGAEKVPDTLSQLFVDPGGHDYRLTPPAARWAALPQRPEGLEVSGLLVSPRADRGPPLIWQYAHPAGKAPRSEEGGAIRGAVGR